MMPSDITSYAASEDLYKRATAGWDAHSVGPLIAMHAVEEPNQVGSCMFEYPAMPAVTYSSPLYNLDERRWQQSVFTGKILSKVDRGAGKDRLYSRKRNTFLEERAARKARQEGSPGCNSSKEDSASIQHAKDICPSNDPSLLLSRLLINAETSGCSSSEKGSKSELYSHFENLSLNKCSRTQLGSSSTQVASSCYSCLDQYTVFDKQQKRNNDDVDGSAKTFPFYFRSQPAVFRRTDLIENLNGMRDKLQCESSVSERWNEKFTKVTKESTMKCSETISSCADQSQQSSGVELRNVDCAPTYLLPGEREELVVIEDYLVIVDQDSNSRGRNVKNCYQRSENEDFENKVGKFHEITSRDWSLNTEIGVQVEETIHDEFSGNRAVMKSKATDELLDDWLIL